MAETTATPATPAARQSRTCAAFMGTGQPPVVAAAAACSVFKAVAASAASRGVALGTLAVALLDALSEGPLPERGVACAVLRTPEET